MKKQLLASQQKSARLANDVAHLGQKINSMDERTRKTAVAQAQARKPKKSAGKNLKPSKKVIFQDRTPTKVGKSVYGSVGKWADLVSNPFTGVPVKCPFNFNPVPSYLSMTVTTTCTRIGNTSAAAGGTTQVVLFPGHTTMYTVPTGSPTASLNGFVSDMDEVAYHESFTAVNSGTYIAGPVNSTDGGGTPRTAIAGVINTGVTLGATFNNSNDASGLAMGWDNPLPFSTVVSSPGQSVNGHMRWKMTAMGVRVKNVTPELSRGGSIVTVQPLTVIDMPTTQAKYALQPTYMDWGPDSATVHWIPRLRDLSYWHATSAMQATAGTPSFQAAYTTTFESAAIVIFLNAPGVGIQTYDMEVVAHWEISGYATQQLSSPTAATPISDGALKGALNQVASNLPSAHGVGEVIESVVGHVVGSAKAAVPRIMSAGMALAKAGARAAVSGV